MGKWLAVTWEGTLVKSLLGALLGALASWLATADVHPLIVALGAAGIPVIMNALSTSYTDYGRGKKPQPEDVATAHEFDIEGE